MTSGVPPSSPSPAWCDGHSVVRWPAPRKRRPLGTSPLGIRGPDTATNNPHAASVCFSAVTWCLSSLSDANRQPRRTAPWLGRDGCSERVVLPLVLSACGHREPLIWRPASPGSPPRTCIVSPPDQRQAWSGNPSNSSHHLALDCTRWTWSTHSLCAEAFPRQLAPQRGDFGSLQRPLLPPLFGKLLAAPRLHDQPEHGAG